MGTLNAVTRQVNQRRVQPVRDPKKAFQDKKKTQNKNDTKLNY